MTDTDTEATLVVSVSVPSPHPPEFRQRAVVEGGLQDARGHADDQGRRQPVAAPHAQQQVRGVQRSVRLPAAEFDSYSSSSGHPEVSPS